jgi:hypothetical protein
MIDKLIFSLIINTTREGLKHTFITKAKYNISYLLLCKINFMKNVFLILLSASVIFVSCNKEETKADEYPKDYEGKWELVKKVYSNGIEENYAEGKDVFYLNAGGVFRREYKDHREKSIDQEGNWKIFIKKGKDEKSDTTYLLKRTPLFNGIFEEQFRVLSKTDSELIVEENDWGFENLDSRDKLHFEKK